MGGNCFWCKKKKKKSRKVFSRYLPRFVLFRFLISLSFPPCLCACTVYTSGSAYLNLSPSLLLSVINISLLTCYPPPPPHSHKQSRIPSDAFFFVYVAYLVWRKPCATYAIYALAFNVFDQKSFVCPLLDCLLTALTAEPGDHNMSVDAHTDARGCADHTVRAEPMGRGGGLNWMAIVGMEVFQ